VEYRNAAAGSNPGRGFWFREGDRCRLRIQRPPRLDGQALGASGRPHRPSSAAANQAKQRTRDRIDRCGSHKVASRWSQACGVSTNTAPATDSAPRPPRPPPPPTAADAGWQRMTRSN